MEKSKMIENEQIRKWIKDGASIDRNFQNIQEKTGFMCSILGHEKTFQSNEIEAIKECIIDYASKIGKSQYIGIWNNKGIIYVDISRRYANKQDAIKNGIKNKQYSIYDLRTGTDIDLVKKTYILYRYNKIKNDIVYIKEYYNMRDIMLEFKKTANTLSNYIIKSIDAPIKELLMDKFVIVQDVAYYRDIEMEI